jgi:hypothetical protein
VRLREPGLLRQQLLDRVVLLERTLDAAAVETLAIDNDNCDVTDVARRMLVGAGWLEQTSP